VTVTVCLPTVAVSVVVTVKNTVEAPGNTGTIVMPGGPDWLGLGLESGGFVELVVKLELAFAVGAVL